MDYQNITLVLYIYQLFFGIVITSIVFAKVGAKLAYQLPSEALKIYFSLLLLGIGIYFIWKNILFF